MKTNLKNLAVAASAGLIIVAAAAFAVGPAMAHEGDRGNERGYDVGRKGQVVGVAPWDQLNVRKWPASYSQKIGALAPQTIVWVERCITVEHATDWCKVGRDATYGWVNSKYLIAIN